LQFAQPASAGVPLAAEIVRIDCRQLVAQSPLIIREVCKLAWGEARWPQQAMGFDQWQQLAQMVRGEIPASGINLPGNIRASREMDVVVLQATGLP
jgi:hypothetical protein